MRTVGAKARELPNNESTTTTATTDSLRLFVSGIFLFVAIGRTESLMRETTTNYSCDGSTSPSRRVLVFSNTGSGSGSCKKDKRVLKSASSSTYGTFST